MGWFSSVVNSVEHAVERAADAVVDGVKKVGEGVMDGAIGKMMSDALGAMGLPSEICMIFQMIGDPLHSTEDLCNLIDKVGQDLGLPKELTGALKRVLKKAEEYAKDFAQGGFGNVVAHMGRDLGLPDEICEGLAAAIDAYTGNEAGAAAHLMKLGADIAKRLGVPDSVTHVVAFAADAYRGDVKGALSEGAQVGLAVVDKMDIAPEWKDLAHVGVDFATGDQKALQADALKMAADVGQRLGLPPEAMGALRFAVAYQQGDTQGMKEAGRELAHDVVRRLPPETRALLDKAVDLVADNPQAALDAIKNLPQEAQEAFKLITNAVKDPALLKQAADAGIGLLPENLQGPLRQAVDLYAKDPKAAQAFIKNLPAEAQKEFDKLLAKATDPETLKALTDKGIDLLPAEVQGPLRQAVDLYAKDPQAALAMIKNLPAEARAEFQKILDQATDPEVRKKAGKFLADQVYVHLPPAGQRAFDVSVHLANGDTAALREDLKKFSEEEISHLPPAARKALQLVRDIADGDTAALKAEFDQIKDKAAQEIREQVITLPFRA
jgi:hypothetical protein